MRTTVGSWYSNPRVDGLTGEFKAPRKHEWRFRLAATWTGAFACNHVRSGTGKRPGIYGVEKWPRWKRRGSFALTKRWSRQSVEGWSRSMDAHEMFSINQSIPFPRRSLKHREIADMHPVCHQQTRHQSKEEGAQLTRHTESSSGLPAATSQSEAPAD